MASPTFQFGKDDFERLIWDAALDPHTKVVALAIRWHMNHKTRQCNPSVSRLARMCGIRDERTLRRCIKDIARVLGVEIIPVNGKPHTFKLKVFETADEIAAMLDEKEWRESHWLLFKWDELENAVSQFRDALAGRPPASDAPPHLMHPYI